MGLDQRCAADSDELRIPTQLIDRSTAAVTHGCPQPTNELIHRVSQSTAVWNTPFDSFWHELGCVTAISLAITIC